MSTMFLNKMFRKESKSEEDDEESNICIVQLTFDFEERLLGTVPSVPVISSLISILGLGQHHRLDLIQKFPRAKVGKGQVVEIIGDDAINNGNNKETSQIHLMELGTTMKMVTSILSFVRGKDFSIVGSTLDSSAFSGYVTKTYNWTLQK